jgi:putative sterol carrier protein
MCRKTFILFLILSLISKNKPDSQITEDLRKTSIEAEDKDMLKLITGGMSGIKAFTSKKIKIKGDLLLTQQAQELFVEAGGVKKVLGFIREKFGDDGMNKSSKL